MMKNTTIEDNKRERSSSVESVDYCCHGMQGKYSGEINEEGKPHGNGKFERDTNDGRHLTYVGAWEKGERVGSHDFYSQGKLLGNIVWD